MEHILSDTEVDDTSIEMYTSVLHEELAKAGDEMQGDAQRIGAAGQQKDVSREPERERASIGEVRGSGPSPPSYDCGP